MTQDTSENETKAENPTGLVAAIRQLAPLWPLVLGLAVGRAGIITSSYGSYVETDAGFITDGATLVALGLLSIVLLVLAVTKYRLPKRLVNRIMRASIAIEALVLFVQAGLEWTGTPLPGLHFALSVVSSLTAASVIYYWLRRARGTGMKAAATLAFAALALSEVEIFVCAMIPPVAANALAGALALVQFPCLLWARRQRRPQDMCAPTQTSDYFGFAKSMLSNKRFLIATAIGIGFLSVVVGLLRGYPDGASIPFTFTTRLAYAALTIAISLTLVVLVLKGRERVMTVGMFLILQTLASLALILYAALPGSLEAGAVLVTTLNALMNGFTWYIIIAFMSFGWRDPYYYAIGGRLVFLGARACSRIFLMFFYNVFPSEMLMNALMSGLIIVSTQVAFAQFLGIARQERDEALREERALGQQEAKRQGVLTKIMGLDEHESLADVRQASMRHNAEELGRQFLLSEREVEVVALYALGYTQRRVAEELFISQGTAHAHIKRIYAKTGLHSRQEILDYMQRYTS